MYQIKSLLIQKMYAYLQIFEDMMCKQISMNSKQCTCLCKVLNSLPLLISDNHEMKQKITMEREKLIISLIDNLEYQNTQRLLVRIVKNKIYEKRLLLELQKDQLKYVDSYEWILLSIKSTVIMDLVQKCQSLIYDPFVHAYFQRFNQLLQDRINSKDENIESEVKDNTRNLMTITYMFVNYNMNRLDKKIVAQVTDSIIEYITKYCEYLEQRRLNILIMTLVKTYSLFKDSDIRRILELKPV